MTLNGAIAVILRYFTETEFVYDVVVKHYYLGFKIYF